MDNKLKIFIGTILVALIGMLSIVANYPKMYSPYSFPVVIPLFFTSALELPKLFIYFLAVLPISAFYLVWSLFFVKRPYLIPKPTIILATIFILLSVAYNASSYKYGIQYQGQLHTFLMYGYNIIFIAVLGLTLKHNKSNPGFYSSLSFNLTLFSWLGWVAFPWLGELI